MICGSGTLTDVRYDLWLRLCTGENPVHALLVLGGAGVVAQVGVVRAQNAAAVFARGLARVARHRRNPAWRANQTGKIC